MCKGRGRRKGRDARRAGAMIAALLLFLGLFAVPASAEEAPEGGDVMVICPAAGDAAFQERVNALCEILTFMAKRYRCFAPEQVESLAGWGHVIVALPEDQSLPAPVADMLATGEAPVMVIGPGGLDQLADTVEYSGAFTAAYGFDGSATLRWNSGERTLRFLSGWESGFGGEIGPMEGGWSIPLCSGAGNVASVPWFDGGDSAMTMALAGLITQWMWPYQNNPWTYSAYLVLDRVFPVDDPERLGVYTEMLREENVPYAICVMPLYDNAHFPAMRQFCEFLRYEQSRGAAIVLRTPQANLAETDVDDMRERIVLSYEAYTQYGVYPVAIAAPRAWMYGEDGLSLIRSSRVVTLFDTDEELGVPPRTNMSFQDGHYIIAPSRDGGGKLYTNAYSTAVYLDANQELEEMRRMVRSYKGSGTTLRSLWNLSSSLYVGIHHFSSEPGAGAFFDGAPASLAYEPFTYAESFDYHRGFFQYLTDQIEASNQLIIAIVLICGTTFVVLIIFARRTIRRQILIAPPDKGGTK